MDPIHWWLGNSLHFSFIQEIHTCDRIYQHWRRSPDSSNKKGSICTYGFRCVFQLLLTFLFRRMKVIYSYILIGKMFDIYRKPEPRFPRLRLQPKRAAPAPLNWLASVPDPDGSGFTFWEGLLINDFTNFCSCIYVFWRFFHRSGFFCRSGPGFGIKVRSASRLKDPYPKHWCVHSSESWLFC